MADPVVPFDYLERMKRRAPAPQPTSDPIAAAIGSIQQDQAQAEIHRSILNAPDPDSVARETRAARAIDQPLAMVEGRVGDVERYANADALGNAVRANPAIQQWAANDPRGAAMAQDDHKSIGVIGSTLQWLKDHDPVMGFARWVDHFDQTDTGTRNVPGVMRPAEILMAGAAALMGDPQARASTPTILRKSPAALLSGASTYTAGKLDYLRGVADTGGFSWASPAVSTAAAISANKLNAYGQSHMPRTGDWLSDQVLGGVSNVPGSIEALIGGLGLRALGAGDKVAALAASALGGMSQGGQSYRAARDEGLGVTPAFTYASADMASEMAGEYLGESQFLHATSAGNSVLMRFIKSQLGAQAGEQFSTVAQDFSAWAALPSNRDKTISDFAAQLPGDMAATAVQTLVAGGLSNLTVAGLERVLDTAASRQRQQDHQTLRSAYDVYRARVEGLVLDRLGQAAAESKLRPREAETFREMMGLAANDAGASHVYISGEALRAYAQTDRYVPDQDPLAEFMG